MIDFKNPIVFFFGDGTYSRTMYNWTVFFDNFPIKPQKNIFLPTP